MSRYIFWITDNDGQYNWNCIIMKYLHLVCILSIIAIAYADELSKEDEEKIVEECQKETNASVDDVKALYEEEIPKTKTQYCLTTCWYKKTGIMDKDNNIILDKALEEMEYLKKEDEKMHDNLVKIIKDCHAKYTPGKECDSIKTFFECMTKSAKEAGIPLEK